MEMSHTGFSPGESSNSQTAKTSSGSYNAQEPQHKVRREVERLEQRSALAAAPALPITWTEDPNVSAELDGQNSVKSRRSMASASSSSAAEMQVLERKRNLAKAELELAEAKARAGASSHSGRSRASRRQVAASSHSGQRADPMATRTQDVP